MVVGLEWWRTFQESWGYTTSQSTRVGIRMKHGAGYQPEYGRGYTLGTLERDEPTDEMVLNNEPPGKCSQPFSTSSRIQLPGPDDKAGSSPSAQSLQQHSANYSAWCSEPGSGFEPRWTQVWILVLLLYSYATLGKILTLVSLVFLFEKLGMYHILLILRYSVLHFTSLKLGCISQLMVCHILN